MSSNPTISEAERLCKKHKKEGIIVFWFEQGQHGLTHGFASYGKNTQWCQAIGNIGNKVFNKISSGEIKP